jgi:antibiotic biosynthesis monooxygenase (ABM) superfamily enzyme
MISALKLRQLITSFVAVYPTITLLGWLLLPHLGDLFWPGRTFVLVLAMVPLVVFIAGPAAHRLVATLWPISASPVSPPQPLDRAT